MATEVDPICKMDVDVDNPPGGQSEYEGTTYYFCAPGCKTAFDANPEKYLSGGATQGTPVKVSFFSKLFGKKS